jgi:DNA-binding IclR family transcriptional regulator
MTRTIKSVLNACRLIQYLQQHHSASVTELADAVGLTPGTVHTYLATLQEENYVKRYGTDYRLGPMLLALGESVRNHSETYRASKEQIDELAEETGECAHLIIEHDGQLFALYERFGSHAVGVKYHERKREQPLNHLHCTAAGKAILSELSEPRVREILREQGMPKNTDQTISEIGPLLAELEEIRKQGYATADEEQMIGIRAVGAPISASDPDPVGAVALSGPTTRFQGDKFESVFPEKVKQVANICEVNLQTVRRESLTASE